MSGQHYIIITFCFCALLNIAITNGGTFTGGATGLDVGSIDKIFGINFDQLRNAHYLVIAALLLCLLVTYWIVHSSYGRTLEQKVTKGTKVGNLRGFWSYRGNMLSGEMQSETGKQKGTLGREGHEVSGRVRPRTPTTRSSVSE